MPVYKIATRMDEITNHVITNIVKSDNGKFIGIRTQNTVLFLATNSSTAKIFPVGIVDVPDELLEKLELEYGLMSKNKTNIRSAN